MSSFYNNSIAILVFTIPGETQFTRIFFEASSSDIDLMVIGTLSFRELVAILKPVEEHMQRPINPTLYSESEFQKKVQDGNHFLLNVLKSDKLFVVGDENDLARLAQ